jgi:hypothetical protein
MYDIKKIKRKINCINLLYNLNFLFRFNRFLIFYLEKNTFTTFNSSKVFNLYF